MARKLEEKLNSLYELISAIESEDIPTTLKVTLVPTNDDCYNPYLHENDWTLDNVFVHREHEEEWLRESMPYYVDWLKHTEFRNMPPCLPFRIKGPKEIIHGKRGYGFSHLIATFLCIHLEKELQKQFHPYCEETKMPEYTWVALSIKYKDEVEFIKRAIFMAAIFEEDEELTDMQEALKGKRKWQRFAISKDLCPLLIHLKERTKDQPTKALYTGLLKLPVKKDQR